MPPDEVYLGRAGPPFSVVLRGRGWLRRTFRLTIPMIEYSLEYSGWTESITFRVERILERGAWLPERRCMGEIKYRGPIEFQHPRCWFRRSYWFEIGPFLAELEVRHWPILALRGCRLWINGLVTYAEGCLAEATAPIASGDVWDRELDG